MSIIKIEEVYLYYSDVSGDNAENVAAAAFMDHSGIPYTKLMYNDLTQTDEVMNSVNTWWGIGTIQPIPPVTTYPFLVYTQVHDDIPARYSPVKYLQGIEDIKTFPELYNTYTA